MPTVIPNSDLPVYYANLCSKLFDSAPFDGTSSIVCLAQVQLAHDGDERAKERVARDPPR